MHEQGVGAGEREIPVKDRTRCRTQGGAHVERSTDEYHDRLVEPDPIYFVMGDWCGFNRNQLNEKTRAIRRLCGGM
jgi:hypothetical protein